jgi:phosphinothricin acetyltransferase
MLKERMIEACPRLGVENLLSMYFDHNEATQRLNDKFGFEGVGHLPEIAEVFGEKRGLRISLLRIIKSEQVGGRQCT